ncbi:MAG: hypothetical protein M3R36_10690 [Bacteroidota bacterium]|nr:hypothetical protein [Bacteroidota bacterium]
MPIDQTFANSSVDPNVSQLINGYVISRDALPPCNCGTSARVCNGTLRACRRSTSPDGGVYTKLDRGGFLGFDYDSKMTELNTISSDILNKITTKKNFIDNPPDPTDPNLSELLEKASEDIGMMALVLEELAYYKTQIQIDLA